MPASNPRTPTAVSPTAVAASNRLSATLEFTSSQDDESSGDHTSGTNGSTSTVSPDPSKTQLFISLLHEFAAMNREFNSMKELMERRSGDPS